jgi:DNA-binding transcriptional LysR family regulator
LRSQKQETSVLLQSASISRSPLSIQIKDLEDVLQVPLLVRDHKGVRATPAAEILITGGRELLRMRDALIVAARALHRVTFVPMRLGFSSFVDHALYEMVCSIHTSLFPSCEIKPKSGDPVDLLLMLERGEIDAALVTLPASGAGLKAYPFTQSRLVVCMKSDDPLARLKEITPADLGSKLTIFRDPRQHPEAHDRLIEMLDVVGITGDVASTNKTPHDLQWMVESGTRHYAPIEAALPNETSGYEWKRETGDIESYKHDQSGGWLHIDPSGQFHDRQAQPITQEAALEHAGHVSAHSLPDNTHTQSATATSDDRGLSL